MRILDLKRIFQNLKKYKIKTDQAVTEYTFYRPVLVREQHISPEILSTMYESKNVSLHTKELKNNYNQVFVTISRMRDIASDILRNSSVNFNKHEQNFVDCAQFFELFLLVCQTRGIKVEYLDVLNTRHKRGVFNNNIYMKYADVKADHPLLKKYTSKSDESSEMKRISLSKIVRDNIEAYGFNYIITNVDDFVHEQLKNKFNCEVNGNTVKIDISSANGIRDGSSVFLYKLENKSTIICEFINKLIEEIKEASSALQGKREYFLQEMSDVFAVFMRLIELLNVDFYEMLNEIEQNRNQYGKFSFMVSKVILTK